MNLLLQMFLPVIAGFVLDLIFGDPVWLYHPVRMIGHLISGVEKIIRSLFPSGKTGERIGGGLLVVIVVAVSMAVPGGILYLAYHISFYLGLAVESFMCYQILATKSLKVESDRVYQEIQTGDIARARKAVSMIVGRDTQNLTIEGVTKAAVETVAENTSDGVIAPLFCMVIGGALLGFCGLYDPFQKLAGAGAGVPLPGFGNVLWQGVKEAVDKYGFMGVFMGGFQASAVGISAALIFGYIASFIFEPKMKK